MKASKKTAVLTILFFMLTLISASSPALTAQAAPEADGTAKLVREADEAYQNGNFKLAIEKYQQAMRLIGEKKELAQTKQELFQTMTSLALTYFTIQENAKAEKQLEDLVKINPNHALDPEFYPPKFIEIFRGVQNRLLGKLVVTSTPAQADVFSGMSKLGQTPLTLERMLQGNYALKVELKGHAPVSKEVTVQSAMENRVDFQLEALPPVVEKKVQTVPTEVKKKKFSPWIIVGGAALAAAVVIILLTAKKDEPEKQLKSLTFNARDPVNIDVLVPTYMPLQVNSVPAKIAKIDYKVTIEHPNHMEDLSVTIVGTDQQTMFNIWNRAQSPATPTVISGTSNDFNNVAPNGIWRLLVQNPGHSFGGRVLLFTLVIYFYE